MDLAAESAILLHRSPLRGNSIECPYRALCKPPALPVVMTEAIIDVEIGIAEFEGRNVPGFMPVPDCPNCNRETMEYVGN